jgi:hypothetical protein
METGGERDFTLWMGNPVLWKYFLIIMNTTSGFVYNNYNFLGML